jgi:pheromone shutdown protein TraB
VGKGQSYPGVDWLASWYERNLRIFANVLRITESTDERILIVYGSGHVPLLMQYLRESKRYRIEPAGRYL